jgi:DNA-binding response OmpR family regulator
MIVRMTSVDVLVVEDLPEFTQIITTVVRSAGHRVRTAATIADALTSLASVPPDLVILDLGLPDGDGLDLCRTIRERSTAYILVLTGRDDEIDMLLGFRLGADDYMKKPFSPKELAARIEALLRRPRHAEAGAATRAFGDLTVDTLGRMVTVAGTPIELTRIEFDIIDALSERPAVVLSRLQLLERVWGPGWVGDDHVIDVHIANLRKKLANGDQGTRWIRTVRGVGYSMGV